MTLVVLAQVGDAPIVAEGLVKNPLAWVVLGLAAAVVWLAKELRASFEARMTEQKAAHDQTVATLTAVITLNLKQAEAVDVLDKAIDRFTQHRED